MFDEFRDLVSRLDRESLRVEKPSHVVFLCGGVIASDADQIAALSLRDYIFRHRKIQSRLKGRIVLAEAAQQLYLNTRYPDLITFEEDIARIASLVLVITESPGSLAELGAFASEPFIRDALRVIISEDHFEQESFVRYGPVKRIENIDRSRIATFPWKRHKSNGNIVKESARQHFFEIVKYINDRIDETEKTKLYRNLGDSKIFYDIIWILSIFEAIPPQQLYDCVKIIHPDVDDSDIRNKLFTLRICEWVDVLSYSNRDFYFLPENRDPFEYRYLPNRRPRDIDAKKLTISNDFKRDGHVNKNVLKRLGEKRGARK